MRPRLLPWVALSPKHVRSAGRVSRRWPLPSWLGISRLRRSFQGSLEALAWSLRVARLEAEITSETENVTSRRHLTPHILRRSPVALVYPQRRSVSGEGAQHG